MRPSARLTPAPGWAATSSPWPCRRPTCARPTTSPSASAGPWRPSTPAPGSGSTSAWGWRPGSRAWTGRTCSGWLTSASTGTRSGTTRGSAVPGERELVLGPEFFERDTLVVARDLLGKLLVRGLAPRNQVMFGPPGHAYVYFVYGMHHCLNFVTRPAGVPQAVLVRALEPGPEVGRCSGPGLVCRSLQIDRSLNGAPLRPPALYLVDDGHRPERIYTTRRVGVGDTGHWAAQPYRFCLDSPHLSRPLPAALSGSAAARGRSGSRREGR